MKAIILTLLVLGSFSLKWEGLSRTNQKHIEELSKSRWGKTMLSMVELHALAGNVVDDLVQGIEELIVDLNDEL